MIDFKLLKGKSISLLIWNTEVENDVRVCVGEIIQIDDEYQFFSKDKKWNITLSPEMLERLKEVPNELKKTLLYSDFGISLSLGSLPDVRNSDNYKSTGLFWQQL